MLTGAVAIAFWRFKRFWVERLPPWQGREATIPPRTQRENEDTAMFESSGAMHAVEGAIGCCCKSPECGEMLTMEQVDIDKTRALAIDNLSSR